MPASRAMPAGPISRNPAESTTTPFTPAAAQASISPGTVAAGVAITARSSGSGTSATVAEARMPSTLARFGLTG